jgi:hypothetical protein
MHDVYKSSIIGSCFNTCSGSSPHRWRPPGAAGAIIGVRTIMWCLIKADQSGASTKRYTAVASGSKSAIPASPCRASGARDGIDTDSRWRWSINTSPYPAPPQRNRLAVNREALGLDPLGSSCDRRQSRGPVIRVAAIKPVMMSAVISVAPLGDTRCATSPV